LTKKGTKIRAGLTLGAMGCTFSTGASKPMKGGKRVMHSWAARRSRLEPNPITIDKTFMAGV